MSNDTKTTIIGAVTAVGGALVDFFAHNTMDGGAIKQPTFWLGLVIAACVGLQGFFTNKAAKSAAPAPEAPKA